MANLVTSGSSHAGSNSPPDGTADRPAGSERRTRQTEKPIPPAISLFTTRFAADYRAVHPKTIATIADPLWPSIGSGDEEFAINLDRICRFCASNDAARAAMRQNYIVVVAAQMAEAKNPAAAAPGPIWSPT